MTAKTEEKETEPYQGVEATKFSEELKEEDGVLHLITSL